MNRWILVISLSVASAGCSVHDLKVMSPNLRKPAKLSIVAEGAEAIAALPLLFKDVKVGSVSAPGIQWNEPLGGGK